MLRQKKHLDKSFVFVFAKGFNDFARLSYVHQLSGFHVFHVFDPMRVAGARPKKRWQLELEGELAGADAVPEVPKVSKATLKAVECLKCLKCSPAAIFCFRAASKHVWTSLHIMHQAS